MDADSRGSSENCRPENGSTRGSSKTASTRWRGTPSLASLSIRYPQPLSAPAAGDADETRPSRPTTTHFISRAGRYPSRCDTRTIFQELRPYLKPRCPGLARPSPSQVERDHANTRTDPALPHAGSARLGPERHRAQEGPLPEDQEGAGGG